MAVISVDFGAAGKHDSKAAANALAEATRTPRPDGSSWAHGRYHHRELESDNRYWTNDRWGNNYDAAIAELRTKGTDRAIRSDAVLLRTIIFQASPEYFFPKIQSEHWTDSMINDPRLNLERGELDHNHVDAFYNSVLSYAQQKWGDKLLSVQLHVDEATPHIHVQIVPITNDGRLCNKELIAGGRAGAKAFVDEVAHKIGKPLGLDRAREMTPEEAMEHEGHKSPDAVVTKLMDEERKQLALIKEQNNALRKSIDELQTSHTLIPEPFTRKQSEPVYKKNIFGQETEETDESYQHRMQELEQIKSDRKQWFSDNQRNIKTVLSDHTRLSNELEERNKTVKRLENEIENLKNERSIYNRINEMSKEVRSIPLEQILLDNGYVLDESVSNRMHKQYRNADDRKVCVSNGTVFVDNHDTSFCGRGPIDLLMCINHGATDTAYYTETVAQLADMYGITATTTAVAADPSIRHHPAVQEAVTTASESIVSAVPRPTYVLPRHNPKKRAQALLWAIHRGIKEQTLDALIASKQVLLDERYGNIVVPRIHGGWFERGTTGGPENRWKKIVGGKDCGPAVIRGPDATENAPLIICESVSDALALVQEYPSAEIAIISGNLRPEIPRKPNQIVYLAFDNDDVGRKDFEYYLKRFSDAKPLFPPARNDWSDYVRDKPEIEAENKRKREKLASIGKAVVTDPDVDSGTTPRPGM